VARILKVGPPHTKIQMSYFAHICPVDVTFEYEFVVFSVNNFCRTFLRVSRCKAAETWPV